MSAPRLPGWARRAWPRTWWARYGDEIEESWVATGARRRDAVRIAVSGAWQRVSRPRPAGALDVPAPVGAPAPAADLLPAAGVAILAVAGLLALQVASVSVADDPAGPVPWLGLAGFAPVLTAVGGARLARRPGCRAVGRGVLAGSVLVLALGPAMLLAGMVFG